MHPIKHRQPDMLNYRCKVCDNTFEEFIFFEGHFDFNAKCREKHGTFLQCFECWQEFQHSAGLRYHLEYHHTKSAYKKPQVPRLTLTKQWKFKNGLHSIQGNKIGKVSRSLLKKLLVSHQKKQLSGSRQANESLISAPIVHSTPKATAKAQLNRRSTETTKFLVSAPSVDFTEISPIATGKSQLSRRSTETTKSLASVPSSRSAELSTTATVKPELSRRSTETTKSLVSVPSVQPTEIKPTATAKPKLSRRKTETTKSLVSVPSVQPTEIKPTATAKPKLSRRSTETTKSLVSVPSVQPTEIKPTATANMLLKPSASTEPLKRNQCHICKFQLVHGGKRLENHIRTHIEGKVKCEICNIRFTSLTLFFHLKVFHKMQDPTKYRCSQCKQYCPTAESLAKHEAGHKSGNVKALNPNKHLEKAKNVSKAGRCKICKLPAMGPKRLAQHMQVHKFGKYKCCNIRFTHGSLVYHQKRCHPELGQNLFSRECKFCKITLATSTALRRHMTVHEGTLKCEICNINFTQTALMFHERKFHPELQRSFVKQNCEVCKAICYTRSALEAHTEMHKTGKSNCELCKISFTAEALETHKRRYHPQNSQCPICKGQFHNIVKHMTVHTIGNIKCEICNIRFTYNSLLHHQKYYHPNAVGGSVQSMKLMRKQQYLQQRQLKAERAVRHPCKVCKLLFRDPKTLEVHANVHITGDVECHICNIRFTKNSLAFHMKRFHSDADRKKRIIRALRRHMDEELNTLNESDATQIPIILEDQYKLLVAQSESQNQCIICKLPCLEAKKLDNHMTVHIEGEYKCQFCNVWFTKNSLEHHQKRYHFEFYEERTLNGIKLIKEHGEDVSEGRQYSMHKCDICKSGFSTEERLAKHKEMHVNGEVTCEVCQVRFSLYAFNYHRRRFHPESKQLKAQSEHNCSICQMKCSDARRLEVHMTVHTEADTECQTCRIPFTKPALASHNRRFHPELIRNSNADEVLRKALARNPASGTLRHVPNESSENGFPCTICDLSFSYRKYFDNHMKVHADGDVRCPVCKIWFTKHSLDYHCKRFHPEMEITKEVKDEMKCEKCQYISRDPSRLQDHMRVHLGNMKCSICNIVFTRAGLVHHYKQFHPNIPKKDRILRAIENCATKKALHSCNRCGKSFTRICYLKLHMKVHGFDQLPMPIDCKILLNDETMQLSNDDLGVRIYQCYVCEKSFQSLIQLKTHLSNHFGSEQWINPTNVHLSDVKSENLKEAAGQADHMYVEDCTHPMDLENGIASDQMEVDEEIWTDKDAEDVILSEFQIQNLMNMENGCNNQSETTQNHGDDVVEILSSDDEEDYETIRYQLDHANLRLKEESNRMETFNGENGGPSSWCISSGSGDTSQSFHCYFCNRRCLSLVELGEHEQICNIKLETIY